jgi:anti-sigma factor RsiW
MNHTNMHDSDFQKFKEINSRRPLNLLELSRLRRFLAGHPEFQRQWEEDAALDRLLHRLPSAQVSSNFTARVMQAAQRAPARSGWKAWWFPARSIWLPWLGLGAAMVCVGLLSFHGYQSTRRAQAARDLASVSRLATLAPMAWLKDFDTIDRLNKVQVADDDLLAALQ